jgi:hypothetical protein
LSKSSFISYFAVLHSYYNREEGNETTFHENFHENVLFIFIND